MGCDPSRKEHKRRSELCSYCAHKVQKFSGTDTMVTKQDTVSVGIPVVFFDSIDAEYIFDFDTHITIMTERMWINHAGREIVFVTVREDQLHQMECRHLETSS